MTKKAIIPILFLLLLTTLACTSADYAAAAHIEYGTVTPETAPISTEAQAEVTMPVRTTATNSPSWRVCTGVENGTLRVRSEAGANSNVVSFLKEGQSIYFDESFIEEITDDGATWLKITDPEGWVNARYICEEKQP